MAARFLTRLKSAMGTWLRAGGFLVGPRQIKNVFSGDFKAAKTKDKMPLIEFDFTEHSAEPLSHNTQGYTVTMQVNVWTSGLRNADNLDFVRDAVEDIFASLSTTTSFDSYGVMRENMTTTIDATPLQTEDCVGCAATVTFNASAANAR